MGVKLQRPGQPGHPGGNRRIYVRVNQGGHRKTRMFNSAKAAEAYAAQVEAWLKIGDMAKVFAPPDVAPAPVRPTLADVVPAWHAEDGAALKASTRCTYAAALAAHILPTFGPRRLNEITSGDVKTWWAALRAKGYSVSHLNVLRVVLHRLFKWAVASDLASRNLVDGIMGNLGDRHTDESDWLTEAELTRLLAAAQTHAPRYFPAILLTATAGLRVGELQGLQVGDVDLARRRLYIRRAFYKGRVDTPKSGRPRVVDLPAATVAVLRDWLHTVEAEAAVRGVAPSWLFPGEGGAAYGDLRRALDRAAKAAGLGRPIRPHLLRHSYASLALQRGVPLLTVSRQLGHASISTTADTYGHLADDAGRQAADAMEAILTDGHFRNPRATDTTDPA